MDQEPTAGRLRRLRSGAPKIRPVSTSALARHPHITLRQAQGDKKRLLAPHHSGLKPGNI